MKYNTRLDLLTFASHGFSVCWSLCQPACVCGRTSDRRCTGKRMPSRTIKVGICSLAEHQESPVVRWPRLWGPGCHQLPPWGRGAAQAEGHSVSTRGVRGLDMMWLDTRWCLQPCRAREWLEPPCPDGDKGLGSSFVGRQPKAWLLEEMGHSKLPGLMLTSPRSSSCNLFPREVGCHGMLMITIP